MVTGGAGKQAAVGIGQLGPDADLAGGRFHGPLDQGHLRGEPAGRSPRAWAPARPGPAGPACRSPGKSRPEQRRRRWPANAPEEPAGTARSPGCRAGGRPPQLQAALGSPGRQDHAGIGREQGEGGEIGGPQDEPAETPSVKHVRQGQHAQGLALVEQARVCRRG